MTSSDLRGGYGAIGAALERTIRADRLSPSYLIEGPDLDVLEDLACAFAAAILAHVPPGSSGGDVGRRIRVADHPDFHVRRKDKATVISVAALTETLERAQGTPVSAARQVFLIVPAEAMEPEGVARYLKALEEPSAATVFLLVSTRPDRLPQAVLSRVRRLHAPGLTTAAIAGRLADECEDARDAERIARWSGGSLTRARRIVRTEIAGVVDALVGAAADVEPRGAAVVGTVLSTLQRAADAEAERSGEGASGRREHVRVLLADVVRCLAVEARDTAATRPSAALAAVPAPAGRDLLEDLGELAAAVPANVTPAVLLIGAFRRLRGVLGPSALRSHPGH